MSTERLLEIKSQIAEAKDKKSEVRGQITSVEAQSKERFKVGTPEEAEGKLEKMGEALDKKEEMFKDGMETLEESYPWE